MPEIKLTRKRVYIIGTVLGVLFLVYLMARGCGNDEELVYDYESIAKGRVKKTISVTGTLEVLNSYTVASKISGMVTQVLVDFNQRVGKGQLLATIDSSEIDQNLLKMSAKLEIAKLELQSAKQDLAGKKNLFKDNLISKKEMERAELQYKQILSQHKQILIDYNIAVKNKSNSRVTSPTTGIVVSREIDPYMMVSEKKVLFVVAESLKKMRLIISVDETDIGFIKNGQKVSFTVSAYPEDTFTGTIDQVRFNPITKGEVVTYESVVLCDNSELLLKPGMTATATIEVANKDGVLRVPNQALIVSPVEVKEMSMGKYVWVKEDLSLGKLPVRRVKIETGIMGDHYAEVLSGKIKEGDDVLIGVHKK